ncbi:MAG: DUF3592 domain-containing protein [Proteobacteria bacterium]|nr:DUF3592 domain-containing protein [Pseudomonadota bacterium]
MDKPWLYIIVPFCSIFIIVGGCLMVSAGRKIVLGAKARHWPQTTGQVLSVESKDTSDSESSSREIRVRYAYRVGGHDYESSTIHPTYGSSSFEQAHRGLESLLRSTQQVRVYYDGSQPSRSTLSVGFYSCSLASFFGGFIFFGAGVGFLLTFWFALAGDWDFARGITVIR